MVVLPFIVLPFHADQNAGDIGGCRWAIWGNNLATETLIINSK